MIIIARAEVMEEEKRKREVADLTPYRKQIQEFKKESRLVFRQKRKTFLPKDSCYKRRKLALKT